MSMALWNMKVRGSLVIVSHQAYDKLPREIRRQYSVRTNDRPFLVTLACASPEAAEALAQLLRPVVGYYYQG